MQRGATRFCDPATSTMTLRHVGTVLVLHFQNDHDSRHAGISTVDEQGYDLQLQVLVPVASRCCD